MAQRSTGGGPRGPRGEGNRGRNGGGNRRNRTDYDDQVWYDISTFHTTFGGLSVMFFGLSQAGFLSKTYATYIEHWMSNLMPIIYLFSMIALSLDASDSGDAQGYLEMMFYALMFPGAFYFMELIHGVGALKYLVRNYPYNDRLLLPSLLYRFGLAEHTPRMHESIIGVDPSAVPFESDPTSADDIVIDDFHAVTF